MVLTARRAQIDNSTDEIQNLHGDSSCANRWNEGAEASKSRIIAPTKLTKAHFHFCLEVNIFLLRAMTTSTIGEEQVTGDDNERGMLSVFAFYHDTKRNFGIEGDLNSLKRSKILLSKISCRFFVCFPKLY